MPEDEEYYDVPEASGAIVSCECSACRELRLRDEDRIPGVWEQVERWMDDWGMVMTERESE